MSGNSAYDRTPEGFFRSIDGRITRLEHRLGGPGGGGGGLIYGARAGLLQPFAGGAVPSGWLLCDGASYFREAYPELFTAIGTTWGSASSTTFNVPDLRGRVVVGRDPSQTEFDVIGEYGGAKTHTLTIAEMPAHSHPYGYRDNVVGQAGGSVAAQVQATLANDIQVLDDQPPTRNPVKSRGGGGAHNNLQPYAVAQWIISTGSSVGGGGTNVPALPEPWVGAYNGTVNITPPAATWADIETVLLSKTFTLTQPLWVMVEISGYLTGTAAAYGMIGVRAAGALTLAPEVNQADGNAAWFGYTAFSELAAAAGKTLTAHKPLLLPAGTTTLRMQARRSTASGTPTLGYPTMIVTPIGWVGEPSDPTVLNRGTTAMRDVAYGVPATDGERVALANRQVEWYNTEKGYSETYYAVTGLTGLTARGLLAGYPSGWYPVAGTNLVCTRIKNNGFQSSPAGTTTAPTLIGPALVNLGGFTMIGTNGIAPPIGGLYNVQSSIYWSGGGAMAYLINAIRFTGGAEITSARIPGNAVDMQIGAVADAVPVPAGQGVEMVSTTSGAQNIYGDGVNRRTFLTIRYAGPPLVNF